MTDAMFGPLIIWYLFFGGAGAGAMLLTVALDLFSCWHARHPGTRRLAWTCMLPRRFFVAGFFVSALVLAGGAICIVFDLGRPERFYFALVHPTFSVLSLGSYVLGGAIACSALLGMAALFWSDRAPLWILRALEMLAVAFSLVTMAYTGFLLMSIDFVVVWDNPLLPVVFSLSGLSTGTALVLVCLLATSQGAWRAKLMRRVLSIDALLIVCEGLALVAFIGLTVFLHGPDSAMANLKEFFWGSNAAEFWIGFVLCGLALPLVMDVVYVKINHTALLAVAAPLVLVGGFYLRYCFVNVSLI